MHKNFGEWYRLVSIEPDGEKLPKRWAGVEEWVSAIRGNDDAILETVRIFQGLPSRTSRDAFLEAFRKHDPAFPQRNELELRVLAGASLVECMRRRDDEEHEFDGVRAAIIAATALEASRLRVSEPQLGEVMGEVLEGLRQIALSQRKRAAFDAGTIEAKAVAAAQGMKQVAAAGDWNQLKAHVAPVFQALLDAVRGSQSSLAAAEHNLRCADEETNILWWLESGSSRSLNKPWSTLNKDAVPLIAGSELADLTDVALGPQDAAALLERIVTKAKGKEPSIQSCVNAVPDDWAKARTSRTSEGALDLAPLSLALSQRGKSDSTSWQHFFEATSGMKASTLLAPERVARQAYVEAVLLRALEDAEN